MATYKVRSGDREHTVTVVDHPGGGATVTVEGQSFEVEPVSNPVSPSPSRPTPVPAASPPAARPQPKRAAPAAGGSIVAPISGKILAVKVKVGDEVAAGQVVLILEAMKMENNVHAPTDGVVKEIAVSEGSEVGDGDLLLVIE
jgi:biotin carboxyl carrier protein